MSVNQRLRNLINWAAVGVLGGAVVGLVDAALAGQDTRRVFADSMVADWLLRLGTGAAFYAQIFLAVLMAAGVFFLWISPWPKFDGQRRGPLRLAVLTWLVATAALYAGIAVNHWAPGVRSWQSIVGNLGVLAGALSLLTLLWRLFGKRSPTTTAGWLAPVGVGVEVLALVVLLVGVGSVGGVDRTKEQTKADRPNILLVTIDSLRADHVASYGYEKIKTLAFSRLAQEGMQFERAVAPTSWTLPSVVSIHTGVYAPVHGQITRHTRLDEGFVTLAESLRDRGYLTAAFLTNGYFVQTLGLDQGFDVYVHARNRRSTPPLVGLSLYDFFRPMRHVRHAAAEVTNRALQFMERHRDDAPWFVWIHYIDPHEPYGDWYLERFPSYRPAGFGKVATVRPYVEDGAPPPDEKTRKHIRACYDAEIIYTDKQVGRLLTGLDRWNLAGNTLVAVTADHGEEFWDHDFVFHGYTLFREVVHVPLWLRQPGVIEPSSSHSQTVSLIDLPATLLVAAGAQNPPYAMGADLLAPADKRALFSSLDKHGKQLRSVHTAAFDLIADLHKQEYRLYAADDIAQQHDLSMEMPEKVDELRGRLDRWRQTLTERRAQVPLSGNDNRIELDRATIESLRALGYLN